MNKHVIYFLQARRLVLFAHLSVWRIIAEVIQTWQIEVKRICRTAFPAVDLFVPFALFTVLNFFHISAMKTASVCSVIVRYSFKHMPPSILRL